MRITLSYPWEGFPPDTVLDIDAQLARRLIHDGRAREAAEDAELGGPFDPDRPADAPAREVPVKFWTGEQLDAYALDHELVLEPKLKRLQKVAVIEAAMNTTRAPEDDNPPPANGSTNKETPHVG